jgi:hypothetical protein
MLEPRLCKILLINLFVELILLFFHVFGLITEFA